MKSENTDGHPFLKLMPSVTGNWDNLPDDDGDYYCWHKIPFGTGPVCTGCGGLIKTTKDKLPKPPKPQLVLCDDWRGVARVLHLTNNKLRAILSP